MNTPKDVLIKGERHLAIHGQLGNLQAKINNLTEILKNQNLPEYLPYATELQEELDFLKRYYPSIYGEVQPVAKEGGSDIWLLGRTDASDGQQRTDLCNALLDMRVLLEAANATYLQDGVIDCRLKTMLDEAWEKAAKIAKVDFVNDLAF